MGMHGATSIAIRGARARRRAAGTAMAAAAVLLVLPAAPAGAKDGAELLGTAATTLKREPLITPIRLGSDPIDQLRYGTPTEGIDLVVPPEAGSGGDAELTLPMTIPAGRGGMQPDLSLEYDSGADAGWLGTGWDLDVGSIEVDTSFGVPRYDAERESETYLLDGDQLSPNAIRTEFVARSDGRTDFTRRVDTQAELITRYGDDPSNYWWEVRDKSGGVRWYGGVPDFGGPEGAGPGGLDEGAVLRTKPGGPIFRWALAAQRDVGVNLVRYRYDRAQGERLGTEGVRRGTQLYLREVLYTARAGDPADADAPLEGETPEEREDSRYHPEDPAWQVRLLRDSDFDPRPAARKDVVVDASGGFLQVTSDLLRRIEVRTGAPKPDRSLRDFDQLSKAFDLEYREGAFGKALLSRVEQIGSDGEVFAANDLGYFDDVRDDEGVYDGFAPERDWDTGEDGVRTDLLNVFGSSALGSSESTAGDASAFLGFNPLNPSKNLAVGGALNINGGSSETLIELLDINGDGLPDKVFRVRRGDVKFRLNRSGPDGRTTFGPPHDLVSLGSLSSDWDIGVGGGPEAYVTQFSAQFSTAGSVAVGENYFEDVNADGLPDFVRGGRVLFNRLDDDGVPTFEADSRRTKAPIGSRDVDAPRVGALDEVERFQAEQSPVEDTVRRWVAPYSGFVDIDGAVTFDPPAPDPDDPRAASGPGDGVRVAIQRGGDELWAARLDEAGESVTPTGVGRVAVRKDQALYFRLQTLEQAAVDRVRWDPEIHYEEFTEGQEGPGRDVNGRLERTYQASDDFTLAGRPAVPVAAPLKGRLHFEATLRKTKVLTDDVTVVVQRNGQDVLRRRVADREVHTEPLVLEADFDVSAPDGTRADLIGVRLETDTDVDVSALEFRPRLFYTTAERDGQPVPTNGPDGSPTLPIPVQPYVDVYPVSSAVVPPQDSGVFLQGALQAEVITTGAQPGTEVVLSIKSPDGLVAKRRATIDAADPDHRTIVRLEPDDLRDGREGPYWVDLTFPDPSAPFVVEDRTQVFTDVGLRQVVAHTRRFAGPQGFFPLAYRGWGYAGYSAPDAPLGAPLDEDAFRFDDQRFPKDPPTGWSVPTYPDPARGRAYPFIPYVLETKDADGTVTGRTDVWRGAKETIVGGAGFARASRRGVDDPTQVQDLQPVATDGAGVTAPRRVGVTGPQFAFTVGLGNVGASFGGSPGFGLVDYLDVNGDAFPDVLTPDNVEFTGPRGAYLDDDADHGDDALPRVRRDSTFGLGGGFDGSAISPKGDETGQATAAPTGQNKGKGKRAKGKRFASQLLAGFGLGGSFGIEASYTNPVSPVPGTGDLLKDLPAALPDAEEDLADVNGDGLPDRIEAGPDGVFVQLNLGYRFDDKSIRWSDGGFNAGETYSGSLGIAPGFQYNEREFSGGLAYNEGVSLARYSWADLNGDGVLDRLRKAVDTQDSRDAVQVAFGTGGGLLPEVSYGDWAQGAVELAGNLAIPLGPQVALDRNRALGGGFDFTFGIGPLCLKLCFIVVNPGVHVNREVSNTGVDLVDVDGDGALDSVDSVADGEITVRRNTTGRSNLLRSVRSSIGSELALDYRREGNTTDSPEQQWALGSVRLRDGHAGDGADVQLRTFDYDGGRYDPLERQFLGYAEVTETAREFQGDADTSDDPVLRTVVRTYRNATVFEAGLPELETTQDADGDRVRETESTWETVRVGESTPVAASAIPANERLGVALMPRRTKLEERFYDDDGGLGQRTWNAFRHDELGNVVWQHDEGEPETEADDLYATTTYSDCTISQSDGLDADAEAEDGVVCGETAPPGRLSPLFTVDRCATWTSIPAVYEVRDGEGRVLRHRDGRTDLCDNSSVTRLEERTGRDGEVAVTELGYDEWGSYDDIVYPGATEDQRVRVHYEYDDSTHAQVAEVTDGHGLVGRASYDAVTGRVAQRVDPNGQPTSYRYDAAHRLVEVRGPYEHTSSVPSIELDYRTDGADPAVIARHFDVHDDDDPIETVAIADGLGRIVQTKRDATVAAEGGGTQDVMVVEGALDRDALGREVRRYAATEEPLGTAHVFNGRRSALPPTTTSYDRAGRIAEVGFPDGSTTTSTHGFAGAEELGGVQAFATTTLDQEQKVSRTLTSVRGDLLAREERGSGDDPVRRTTYGHTALGELARVVEPGGGVTRHTYDGLGRRTSTDTPDGGLVERHYDVANQVAKTTPRTRATGTRITYAYDQERLVGIDHPDAGTPDVRYEYGVRRDDGTYRAGRITRVVDGARDKQLAYDRLGRVARETALMKVAGYDKSDKTRAANTYVTSFTWDTLGRLGTLTYPDGEVLSHDYDRGGLLRELEGSKKARSYAYASLQHDRLGAKREQRNGNGTRTSRSYDPLTRRLERQVTTTPARTVQDIDLEYDLVGNVVRQDNALPAPVPSLKGGPGWQAYRYDDFHRLVGATGRYDLPGGARREHEITLEHDLAGNVVAKRQRDIGFDTAGLQKPVPGTTYERTYAYDPARAHRVATSGDRAFRYDADGNLAGWVPIKGGERRTLTWDTAGRLRSATDGLTDVSTYDADGRLAIQVGRGGTFAFVNQWYTATDSGKRVKHVFAGHDRVVSKQVDDKAEEGVQRWLHTDLQGSVNVVTDKQALVTQHTEYFATGEPWIAEDVSNGTSSISADDVPQQFAGGYTASAGALTDFGQRWYDARDGIFTAPEPLLTEQPEAVLRNPGLLGAYAYADGSPVRFTDRTGREADEAQSATTSVLGDAVEPAAPAGTTPQAPAAVPEGTTAPAAGGPEAGGATTAAPDPGTAKEEQKKTGLERWGGRLESMSKFLEKFGNRGLLNFGPTKGKDGKVRFDVTIAPTLTGIGEFSGRDAGARIRRFVRRR